MNSIIDVSSVVYGGHNGLDRRISGFPIGGLRKLFGIINAGLSLGDFILCFDGSNIIKKELLPTYKSGRIPDYSVIAQIELAKELLTKCDIPFYLEDGYEADDLIYSVCYEMLCMGDTDKILIYTDDRDISCCVTDNISIQNVTTNGIRIDIDSYVNRVVSGRQIPYNSILLWKIFHGDASDNYKALRIPGLNFENVANNFIEQLEPLIGPEGFNQLVYSDYDVFEVISDDYKNILTKEELSLFKQHGRIAYPYKLKVSDADVDTYKEEFCKGMPLYAIEREHLKMFGSGNFNRKKFDFYCTMLGLNRTRYERSVDKESAEAQDFYNLLSLRATELSNGELAVKYSRSKRIVRDKPPTIENMMLPI